MFTGIIQEIGTIAGVKNIGGGLEITVTAKGIAREVSVDDSVSVNGVCQTIVHKESHQFRVIAVEETLSKTTLGRLVISSPVNLELAMKLDGRLGGHLVLGHVDGIGKVVSVTKRETSWLFEIVVPPGFHQYVIPVGSIAIDGVSLTLASINDDSVVVSIIPHTMENTIFWTYKVGTMVNLEFDVLGKYVQRMLGLVAGPSEKGTISKEQLSQWGYKL
jgi:riboflavin synthase